MRIGPGFGRYRVRQIAGNRAGWIIDGALLTHVDRRGYPVLGGLRFPEPGAPQIHLVRRSTVFVFNIFRRVYRRYHILFLSPRAKVYLFTAVAAKWAKLALVRPDDLFTAGRTINLGCHRNLNLKITKRKLKWYIALMRFGFHITALRHETYPQHVLVGGNLWNRSERFVDR